MIWWTFPEQYDETVYELVVESDLHKFSSDSSTVSAQSLNILSTTILKVFCFTEYFVIDTFGDGDAGLDSYRLDLKQFMDIISGKGTWKRMTIEGVKNGWISDFWNSDEKQEVLDLYAARNLFLQFEPKPNSEILCVSRG